MKLSGAGVRSILSNATYLVGSQAATMLARGILVIVLARALGPESFGTFNYALAWYLLFISLTYLGLDAWLVRQVATDRAGAPEALRRTLVLRTSAALAVAVGSCLIAGLIEPEADVWLLNAIFSIALFGRAVWLWAVSAFTAFERTHFALRWDSVFRPIEIVAVLVVLAWRPELHWLAATHAILWCLQGAVGLYTVTHRLSPLAGRMAGRESMRLLARTMPAGLYTIVICVFMQVPIVIMKLIEPDEFRLGQFALAYQACMYVLIAPYIISSAMLPVVSRATVRGDGKDVALVGLLVRSGCILGAALVVVLGPVIPALTQTLFGSEYSAAGELLRRAVWLAIPFASVNFLLPLFFARSAYGPVGLHGALGVALMLATMIVATAGAPQSGSLLSVGVGLSGWFLLTLGATRSHVPSFDRSRSIGAFASAVATFLVYSFAAQYGLGTATATSLALLAVTTAVFRLVDRDDLRIFRDVLGGAGRGIRA
jgi:O-antigen/teichoic acid export membrane protein